MQTDGDMLKEGLCMYGLLKTANVTRRRGLGDELREIGRGQITKAFVDHSKWFGLNSEYNRWLPEN